MVVYPYKVYAYQSLKQSLETLLLRQNFREMLHKTRKVQSNVMYDITDGNVFLNFVDNNGHPYFSDVRNLGLMINVDWFQPFQNVQHSVGVIYLVIVNLPREVRFRQENVIVLGVIPGPSEPSLNINAFLAPLVDELLAFLGWNVDKRKFIPFVL